MSAPRTERKRLTPHPYWNDFVYEANHWSWHDARAKGGTKRRYRLRCAPKRHRLRGDVA